MTSASTRALRSVISLSRRLCLLEASCWEAETAHSSSCKSGKQTQTDRDTPAEMIIAVHCGVTTRQQDHTFLHVDIRMKQQRAFTSPPIKPRCCMQILGVERCLTYTRLHNMSDRQCCKNTKDVVQSVSCRRSSWIQDGLWQGFEKRATAIHMMICLFETELGLCSEGLGAGEDAWVAMVVAFT